MTLRTKLLGVITDIDIGDIGNEALVDILVAKLKSQEETISKLMCENKREREALLNEHRSLNQISNSLINQLKIERRNLLTNPLYGARGYYYYIGENKTRIRIEAHGGDINVFMNIKNNDYAMRQVDAMTWDVAK